MNQSEHLAGSSQPNGYVLLHKEPGPSSFAALSLVKRALGTGRVGHTGTLDSFAEGLLLVFVGRATRLVTWAVGCDKEYEGTIFFGAETDTLEPEGAVIAQAAAPTEAELRRVLPQFTGPILQAPPLYSSVHVNGQRAHEIARAGKTVEMAKRPVTIYALDLLDYDGTRAKIRVACSKGTYIRSLARDIALACHSRGHLIALKRTKLAGYSLGDALHPWQSEQPEQCVKQGLKQIDPPLFVALGIPAYFVSPDKARYVAHGKPFDVSWVCNSADIPPRFALFRDDNLFLALLVVENNRPQYGFVSIRPEEIT